jgi:hypothetical protein
MYATAFRSFLSLRNQETTQSRHHRNGAIRPLRALTCGARIGDHISLRALPTSRPPGRGGRGHSGWGAGAPGSMGLHGAGDLRHRTAPTGDDRRRTPRLDVRPQSDCEDGRRARRPDRAPEHGDARGWCSPTRSLCRYPVPAPSGSRQPRRSARRAPLPAPSAVVGTRATAEASTAARPPGPAPRPTVGWRARP